MSDNDRDKSLTTPSSGVPTEINPGTNTLIDLSGLPENVRTELQRDYTEGMIDIAKKARELGVDADALKRALERPV